MASIKELESALISKNTAVLFAMLGVALGSVAYLKFKEPVEAPTPIVVKDNRNPVEVERDHKIEKASGLLEKRLYKNAEEILSQLYKEIPKDVRILSMLAMCEKKIGQIENAETHLKEAIAVEPGQWIFHHNIGVLLFDKGKPEESLESFKKALELSPKNYKILLSQAKVQELTGKFTDARLSYGRAIEGGQMDGGTASVVKERLKRLDVLAYIERGDK